MDVSGERRLSADSADRWAAFDAHWLTLVGDQYSVAQRGLETTADYSPDANHRYGRAGRHGSGGGDGPTNHVRSVFLELGPMEIGTDAAEGGDMDSDPILFDRGGTNRPRVGLVGHGPPDSNVGIEDEARALKARNDEPEGRKLTGSTIAPERDRHPCHRSDKQWLVHPTRVPASREVRSQVSRCVAQFDGSVEPRFLCSTAGKAPLDSASMFQQNQRTGSDIQREL
jgi:hypothetical protein